MHTQPFKIGDRICGLVREINRYSDRNIPDDITLECGTAFEIVPDVKHAFERDDLVVFECEDAE